MEVQTKTNILALATYHEHHKYRIGAQVKKIWSGKTYTGSVTKLGHHKGENTYQITYEDNDEEVLTEKDIESIIICHRKSI